MPALVILAAGMSSRYGAPKQFEAVGPRGEALMDYAVFDALTAGCDRVIMVVNASTKGPAEIHCRRWTSVQIDFALQDSSPIPGRAKPWGTAHALLEAARKADDAMVVINADDFYGGNSLAVAANFLVAHPDQNALVGFEAGLTMSPVGGVSRGFITETSDRLVQIIEYKNLQWDNEDELSGETVAGEPVVIGPGSRVSMNLWAFGRGLLLHLEAAFDAFISAYGDDLHQEFFIGDVVNDIVASDPNSFHLLPSRSSWFGMTFPGDRAHVTEQLATLTSQGTYPSPLFEE